MLSQHWSLCKGRCSAGSIWAVCNSMLLVQGKPWFVCNYGLLLCVWGPSDPMGKVASGAGWVLFQAPLHGSSTCECGVWPISAAAHSSIIAVVTMDVAYLKVSESAIVLQIGKANCILKCISSLYPLLSILVAVLLGPTLLISEALNDYANLWWNWLCLLILISYTLLPFSASHIGSDYCTNHLRLTTVSWKCLQFGWVLHCSELSAWNANHRLKRICLPQEGMWMRWLQLF